MMNNVYQSALVRAQTHHELADIRQDTREALAKQRQEAAEREALQLRREAEREALRRQYEQDLCQANQEALQRNIERQIRESLTSKVAFDVRTGFEVGELEVDVEALKKLLEKREQEALVTPREALQRGCGCEQKECGCRPGLLKGHCPRCMGKKCRHPEPGCGGPEALERLAQQPLRKPLKPTEIPLKMNVKLVVGMDNPQITQPRVTREALVGPPEALRKACDQEACDEDCDAFSPRTSELPNIPAPTPDTDDRVADPPKVEEGPPVPPQDYSWLQENSTRQKSTTSFQLFSFDR